MTPPGCVVCGNTGVKKKRNTGDRVGNCTEHGFLSPLLPWEAQAEETNPDCG